MTPSLVGGLQIVSEFKNPKGEIKICFRASDLNVTMKQCVLIVCLMISCFVRTVVLQTQSNPCSAESAQCCQQSSDVIGTLTEEVKRLSDKLDDVYGSVKECSQDICATGLCVPQDCTDISKIDGRTSGVYQIFNPINSSGLLVYCDLSTPGGDWLVFQRRKDGSENYDRIWVDYANGFGKLEEEFWLGNEALFVLTDTASYKLRVDMEDWYGQTAYAEYSTFKVASSADNYRLTVYGYSGNAGDSLAAHDGQQFSTKDADHDQDAGSCAGGYFNGFWYNRCHTALPNGLYQYGNATVNGNGVIWSSWHGFGYSLKSIDMKIARV